MYRKKRRSFQSICDSNVIKIFSESRKKLKMIYKQDKNISNPYLCKYSLYMKYDDWSIEQEYKDEIIREEDKIGLLSIFRNTILSLKQYLFTIEEDLYIYSHQKYYNYKNKHNLIYYNDDKIMDNIKEFVNELIFNRMIWSNNGDIEITTYTIILYYAFFEEILKYRSCLDILNTYPKYISNEKYSKDKYNKTIEQINHLTKVDLFKSIIKNFRENIGVLSNDSVKSHYYNYSRFYNYLLKYNIFKEEIDEFLKDIIEVAAIAKELDIKSEFDYTMLLKYIIYNEPLDMLHDKDELSLLVPKVLSGEELIDFIRIKPELCYYEVPRFVDSVYLTTASHYINSAVVEKYDLDRNKNDTEHYINEQIYKWYIQYQNLGITDDAAFHNIVYDFKDAYPYSDLKGKKGKGKIDFDRIKNKIKNYKAKINKGMAK